MELKDGKRVVDDKHITKQRGSSGGLGKRTSGDIDKEIEHEFNSHTESTPEEESEHISPVRSNENNPNNETVSDPDITLDESNSSSEHKSKLNTNVFDDENLDDDVDLFGNSYNNNQFEIKMTKDTKNDLQNTSESTGTTSSNINDQGVHKTTPTAHQDNNALKQTLTNVVGLFGEVVKDQMAEMKTYIKDEIAAASVNIGPQQIKQESSSDSDNDDGDGDKENEDPNAGKKSG